MGEETPPVERLIAVDAGICADAEAYVREARPHWDWGGCTISLGALGSLTQSMTVESTVWRDKVSNREK